MIRAGTVADVRDRGAALIPAAAAETGCGEDVQWAVLEQLEQDGALLVRIVEVDGEVVGWACAVLSGGFWSAERTLRTLSLFVAPSHRWRWGLRLVRVVIAAASSRGARLCVPVPAGSRIERLLRALRFRATVVEYGPEGVHYSAASWPTGSQRSPAL